MKLPTAILDLLSPADRKAAQAIADSPVFEKALDDVAHTQEQHRRELAAQLAATPGEFAGMVAEASRAASDTLRARAAAELHLRDCKDASMVAAIRLNGIVGQEERKVFVLEKELRDIADQRLFDCIYYLAALKEEIKDRLNFGRLRRRNLLTGWVEQLDYSNIAEITEVDAVLGAAIAEIRAMQIEPLSRSEVTDRLQALVGRLIQPLKEFELMPPRVTSDEVKAPEVGSGHLRIGLENPEMRDARNDQAAQPSKGPKVLRTVGG